MSVYFWHKINLEWFTLWEDFEDQHGGYGVGGRKKEGRIYVEFCAPINITIHALGKGKGIFNILY